jgi:hypothetical protein
MTTVKEHGGMHWQLGRREVTRIFSRRWDKKKTFRILKAGGNHAVIHSKFHLDGF